MTTQPGFNGVILDVPNHALFLGRIAYAAVKIIPTPERAGSAQESICASCAGDLGPGDNSGEPNKRQDDEMNMIGHHHPASQFIEALVLPLMKSSHHDADNIGLHQPLWSGSPRIENAIEGDEFRSVCGVEVGYPSHRE